MKKYVVIAYDIEDDKKRRNVVKLLQPWGKRVNKSVFECFLSDTELAKLKVKLKKIRKDDDSILVYPLCATCLDKVERYGFQPTEHEVVKIF
ncbi:MAG TPA: CRISPR-associated endonuclease Cas2 [Desulfuromonadales bacterium]|nr:CRISPR-associated endonuclease Cas2 [Desulfuromonadales bacterium]